MDKEQEKIVQSLTDGLAHDRAHYADWAAVIVRLQAEAGLTFREAQELVPISEGGYMIDEDARTRRSRRELGRRGLRKIAAAGHDLDYYLGGYRPEIVY